MRKGLFKIVSASVLALALASCKTAHHGATSGYGAQGANAGGTYAQGVGGEGGDQFGQSSKCLATTSALGGSEQHYFFDFNQNNVRSGYMSSLQVQANYLLSHPNVRVRLTGNTDSRGSREYNIGLGWRRVRAISQILQQDGVPASRITSESYGSERPAAFGETESAYQCNRRVDLTYGR